MVSRVRRLTMLAVPYRRPATHSWEDLDSAATFLDGYAGLLSRIETLTGRTPVVAVAGHAESRGCLEMCSPGIANLVRLSASSQHLLANLVHTLKPTPLVSFDQRMNRRHQNMFFSAFVQVACEEVPAPSASESVTVIAEDSGLLKSFCRHLSSCMTEAGLEKKPVKQLCIMSRDDEFSLNAKSMYVVVVQGEGDVIASDSPEGDYRSILHRILFHTGRLPIIALSGPLCEAEKLQELFKVPAIQVYKQQASYFPETPNREHMLWLVSALLSEGARTEPPLVSQAIDSFKGATAALATPGNNLNKHLGSAQDAKQSSVVTRAAPQRDRAASPVSSLQKRIADTRMQIEGLQNVDGENMEKNRVQSAAASSFLRASPSSPSVNDVEKALNRVISRGGKLLPPVPSKFHPDDLLLDLQEAQPAKSYTDLLLARPASLEAQSSNPENSRSHPSVPPAGVQGSKGVSSGITFDTAQSASFVDAWSDLEKLKRDHENAMQAERERASKSAGCENQDLLAKANTLTLQADAERQELIQKIKIQQELDEQNSKLERLKQEAHSRAEAVREEMRRLAAAAEREAEIQRQTAERTAKEARYRELESKALNCGVQHLAPQHSTFEGEVVYEVPQHAAAQGNTPLEKPISNEPASPSHSPPPVNAKGGSWVPALAALAGMETSETPSQIPSPEKFAVRDVDRAHSELEEEAVEQKFETSASRPASGNQLRQSASSDHETIPHERSPQDDREAAVKEQVATTQRGRPLPAPPVHADMSKSNPPVTPIAPRVLVPVDRDSPNHREVASAGGKSIPRVIARRPSSAIHDAPPSPAAASGPRVLSHRPSTAASSDCTPLGSPRLRQSDDSLAKPESNNAASGGDERSSGRVNDDPRDDESCDVEECSDYPASPTAIGDHGDVGQSVPSTLPSPPKASNVGALSNDGGDSAYVGIGLTLALDQNVRQFVVKSLEPASSAAKSLAANGDIVHSIDGQEIQGMDEATVNSMLVGVAHSAVVLGLKHSGAGNHVSDVVIIRVPKSNADSRVAPTDVEPENLGPSRTNVARTSPHQHSPPGLMWASLRAQVDMFADDQRNEEVAMSSTDRHELEHRTDVQSGAWLPGAPGHGQSRMPHNMVQHPHQLHHHPSRSTMHPQLHPQLHTSNTGYSGDTIRAVPTDRMGPVHPHQPPHPHLAPPHHHGHHSRHQQPWHGSLQPTNRNSGGLPNRPSLLPRPQQAGPGSATPHSTPILSSQPMAQPAQGGLQDSQYEEYARQPRGPAPQASASHVQGISAQSSHLLSAPRARQAPESVVTTGIPARPVSAGKNSVHSSIKSAAESSDEGSDIMDIPYETTNDTAEGEGDTDSKGAGGVPPFQAAPPTATPAKAPLVERGDFGFQVAQIVDKKREAAGDCDSMRVSFVAPEGAARFSGQVIKGAYLVRVNQTDLRGKPLGEVMDAIREAPKKSTFEFLDPRNQGTKNKVTLLRELRGREDFFVERLHRMHTGTTDMQYLSKLRNNSAYCGKEEHRPSFVVCGFPGVGKSTLINTMLAAINSSDYGVADTSTPSMQYTRYEQVLRGADNNPFVIADTSGLTGDDTVFASLRNIVKGRHKNNSRMDNSWRSIKAVADAKKRAHALILVADARQKVSSSIVDALNDICAAEDDLPVVVAWTNLRDISAQEATERMRSMLAALPRAVNFPVLHYKPGQSGIANVDYTVLDMLSHLRTQALRYIKFSQHEASVK